MSAAYLEPCPHRAKLSTMNISHAADLWLGAIEISERTEDTRAASAASSSGETARSTSSISRCRPRSHRWTAHVGGVSMPERTPPTDLREVRVSPAPGQVWESRDPRDDGRTVVVERVDGFIYVKGSRRSRVRVENFPRLYRFVR